MQRDDLIAQWLAGTSGDRLAPPFRLILGLIALCFCFRLFLAVNTAVVGGDSTAFLWGVRRIASEAHTGFLKKDKLLFQLMIYVLRPVFGGAIPAGMFLSVFFSSLSAGVLYLLYRDHFSLSVSVVAVLLFIFHPLINDEHTKVITDATFTFFFLSSIYVFQRYLSAERFGRTVSCLAGAFLLSVLAVLTRAEGVVLFGLHSLVLFWQLLRPPYSLEKNGTPAGGLLFYTVLPVAGGFLLLGGEFLNVFVNPGQYSSSLGHFFSALTGEVALDPVRKWAWYNEILNEFMELPYYHIALFLVLGPFVLTWKRPVSDRVLYLSYVAVYYLAAFLSLLGNPDPSFANERYWMPGFILLLPLAAAGVVWTCNWLRTRQNRRKTAAAVLAITLIGLVPRTLEKGVVPRNRAEIGLKKAGLWVRHRSPLDDPRILSVERKSAYYTGVDRNRVTPVQDLPHDTLDVLLAATKPDYLIFSEHDLDEVPLLEQVHTDPRFQLRYSYGGGISGIHTAYVYRISPD